MNIADDLVKAYNDGYQQGKKDAVVRGEWVYSRMQSELAVSKCSNCGKEQFSISHVVAVGNYCPNCGAKMESEGGT